MFDFKIKYEPIYVVTNIDDYLLKITCNNSNITRPIHFPTKIEDWFNGNSDFLLLSPFTTTMDLHEEDFVDYAWPWNLYNRIVLNKNYNYYNVRHDKTTNLFYFNFEVLVKNDFGLWSNTSVRMHITTVSRAYLQPIGSAISIVAPNTDIKCVICLSEYPNIIFNKCKHVIVCSTCYYNIFKINPQFKCPYCREIVHQLY